MKTTMNSGLERWTKRLLGGLGILVIATLALVLTSRGANSCAGRRRRADVGRAHVGRRPAGMRAHVDRGTPPEGRPDCGSRRAIYWLVGRRTDERIDDGALAALRERYARGEITADEYETRQSTLEGEER